MTNKDLSILRETLDTIRLTGLIKGRIAIHSPWPEQTYAVQSCLHNVTVLMQSQWDITTGPYKDKFDLLIFNSVFHYIEKPLQSFDNVLKSCNYLLIQDLIIRNRGSDILGSDGDKMRYSMHPIISNYHEAFDLNVLKHHIIFIYPYPESTGNIHFIALMKGKL